MRRPSRRHSTDANPGNRRTVAQLETGPSAAIASASVPSATRHSPIDSDSTPTRITVESAAIASEKEPRAAATANTTPRSTALRPIAPADVNVILVIVKGLSVVVAGGVGIDPLLVRPDDLANDQTRVVAIEPDHERRRLGVVPGGVVADVRRPASGVAVGAVVAVARLQHHDEELPRLRDLEKAALDLPMDHVGRTEVVFDVAPVPGR